jgi:SAM-dependent methyltransferase
VPFPVEVLSCSAESIPLGDGTVDTAVSTWTLCSIGDPIRALREVSRVLRPGGHLIFIEHGRSPDVGTAAWQRRLTPLWRRVAGGCHLDRPIPELIASAGFHREEFEDGYARGPRVTSFFYRGVARVDA